MQEAAGLLEVFGCVAAFAAADAAAKAANVTIQSIDKNKPANADALPVPLITMPEDQGQRSGRGGCNGCGSCGSREYQLAWYPVISSPVRLKRLKRCLGSVRSEADEMVLQCQAGYIKM